MDDLDRFDEQLARMVRVGLGGNAAGMRHLIDRLVRANVPEPRKALRDALALAAAQTETPFVPFRSSEEATDLWPSYEGPQRIGSEPVASPPEEGLRLSSRHLDTVPDGLSVTMPAIADEPLVPAGTAHLLHELINEHRSVLRLRAAGLSPTRSLLLTGLPGTGKTYTASWVASELDRPLIALDLAMLITHELGRSARNLQRALQTAARMNAVLFLDELDALARARAEAGDVGEMKRLVNVLLIELDRWPADRLLVAATNHPQLLDPAVSRRFERNIELPLPDATTRELMFDRYLPDLDGEPDGAAIARLAVIATDGWNGAAISVLAAHARRAAVLQDGSLAESLLREIAQSGAFQATADRDAAIGLLHQFGMTQRQIGQLLHISHPTVGAALKRLSTGA